MDMPADVSFTDNGGILFELATTEGPVKVSTWGYWWKCRGSAAALLAAGLLRPEWCPGRPGNNKVRQSVFFDSAGAKLVGARQQGKKLPDGHITVSRSSTRTYCVEIPLTPKDRKRTDPLLETARFMRDTRINSDRQAAYEKQRDEERIARAKNETSSDVRGELAGLVSAAKKLLPYRIAASRFRYAEDVLAQVNQHLEAAKQVLLTSKLLPASSEYQREGNVVFFPALHPEK